MDEDFARSGLKVWECQKLGLLQAKYMLLGIAMEFAEYPGEYQLHLDSSAVGNSQLFDSCLLCVAAELINYKN